MRWSLLVVVLLARVALAETVVPWPSPLPERAWQVGQWVHYTSSEGDEVVVVIAKDACGTWIEWTVTRRSLERWTVCFDANEQPVRAFFEPDGGPRYETELRRETRAFLQRRLGHLVSPPDAFGSEHQDLEVPAGRFEQAVRDARVDSRWFHPAVPLAGFIRARDFALIGFGTSRSLARDPLVVRYADGSSVPRTFFALAIGWDRISGREGMAAESNSSIHVPIGYRIAQRVDAVAVMGGAGGQGDRLIRMQLGARWSPFRAPPDVLPGRMDWSAIYLQGQVGYTELRRDGDSAGRGIGFGMALGWLPVRRVDWAVGFEVGGGVGFYSRGEGNRRDLWFASVLQLFDI